MQFEISDLRRHADQTFRALFAVTLRGVVIADCRYHVGRYRANVAGPGVRSQKSDDKWRAHATFGDDLAMEIREAVEGRLVADEADIA